MGDIYHDNVKLLLPMNGIPGSTAFTDYSTLQKTVNRYGDAVQSADIAGGQYGTSLKLDGSGDYLETSNTGFNFHNSDYTVEFWEYFNALPVGKTVLTDLYTGTGQRIPLYVRHASSLTGTTGSNLVVGYFNGAHYGMITSFVPTTGQWHHIAITRSGNVLTAYANGNSVGTYTITSAVAASTQTVFRIGRGWDSVSTSYLAGYLQDLRITAGAVRYTENFTVPDEGFYDTAPTISSSVCSAEGAPVERTVRVYLRSTGALVKTVTSDPITGEFSLVGLSNAAHDVQILAEAGDGCDIFVSNQTPA